MTGAFDGARDLVSDAAADLLLPSVVPPDFRPHGNPVGVGAADVLNGDRLPEPLTPAVRLHPRGRPRPALVVPDEQPVRDRLILEHEEALDLPGGDLLPVELPLPLRGDLRGVPGHPLRAFVAEDPQHLGGLKAVNDTERDHRFSANSITASAT